MRIKQYLYVSSGKIESIDLGARTWPRVNGSVKVGLPPVLSVEASMAQPGASEVADFKRLERLSNYLLPNALEYDDPDLAPMGWLRFDMLMNYGTLHADAGGPDHVAAFTGPAPYPIKAGEVDLILIGSTCHLRDRIGSTGRMGSTSDALFALARNPNLIRLDEPDIGAAPDPAWPAGVSDAAMELARIMDWYRPKWQRARVKGLAQVLHLRPDSYITKLVVATPLYVQFSGLYGEARTRVARSAANRWGRRRLRT